MSFTSNFKFQISNLFIKANLPAILTIALLIATVGILFWYGNFKINKANNINSTIIAWENLDNHPLCKGGQSSTRSVGIGGFLCKKSSNLNLIIHNATKQEKTYQIKWLLNKKIVDTSEATLVLGTTKTILPTKKVLTSLEELLNNGQGNNQDNNQTEILYQVKISWDKNSSQANQQAGKTETLGKWIKK